MGFRDIVETLMVAAYGGVLGAACTGLLCGVFVIAWEAWRALLRGRVDWLLVVVGGGGVLGAVVAALVKLGRL